MQSSRSSEVRRRILLPGQHGLRSAGVQARRHGRLRAVAMAHDWKRFLGSFRRARASYLRCPGGREKIGVRCRSSRRTRPTMSEATITTERVEQLLADLRAGNAEARGELLEAACNRLDRDHAEAQAHVPQGEPLGADRGRAAKRLAAAVPVAGGRADREPGALLPPGGAADSAGADRHVAAVRRSAGHGAKTLFASRRGFRRPDAEPGVRRGGVDVQPEQGRRVGRVPRSYRATARAGARGDRS